MIMVISSIIWLAEFSTGLTKLKKASITPIVERVTADNPHGHVINADYLKESFNSPVMTYTKTSSVGLLNSDVSDLLLQSTVMMVPLFLSVSLLSLG